MQSVSSSSQVPPLDIIGGGLDITGREIEFLGEIWTITCKNYLGWWDVVRREQRGGEIVKITTQIAPEVLPQSHPKYARLIPLN